MQNQHRHIIALPIAIVLLLTAALTEHALVAGTGGKAAEVSASGSVISGIAVIPFSESGSAQFTEEKNVRVDNGSFLIRALTLGNAEAGSIRVVWFAGTAGILQGSDAVTVIAIDTPVIVLQADDNDVLPAGTQLRIDSDGAGDIVPVPEIWLSERRDQAMLAAVPSIVPESWSGALTRVSQRDAAFILMHMPSLGLTRTQAEQAIIAARILEPAAPLAELVALHLLFNRHYPDAYAVLEQTLLTSRASAPWAEAVLASASRLDHPLPQHAAVWLRLAKRRAALDQHTACDDAADAKRIATDLDDGGFPQSAAAWHDAVGDFMHFCASLNVYADSSYKAVPRTQSGAGTSSAPPAAIYDAAHSVEKTRQDLMSAGALIAVTTEFTPAAPEHRYVNVSLVLARNGTVRLSFTYDIETGMALAITQNDVALPNAVPLQMLFQ